MICPLCAREAEAPFFVRRGVPVHQNSLVDSEPAARSAPRGDLALCVCARCGFVFNGAFDSRLLRYGEDYENSQDWSAVFERYLDDHVRHMVDENNLRGANIVEVGCGKGRFLQKLVLADPGNRGWGFDPSYVGPDETLDGRVKFRREFFGGGPAGVAADFVVCRHVIEHVADPVGLLKMVRAAVPDGKNVRLFFETPCFDWILKGSVFWDIFYEHCNYFTSSSLRAAFEVAGYSVLTVSHVFGGQYLWLEATTAPSETYFDPEEMPARAQAFAARVREYEDNMRRRLQLFDGPVAVWGAGAKGVTFANVLDPQRQLLRCIVDINQRKQGRFVPGTGHEIVAPEALGPLGVRHVIVMNPYYSSEIAAQATAAGLRLEIHTAEASECA
jgi:hypothetical protein